MVLHLQTLGPEGANATLLVLVGRILQLWCAGSMHTYMKYMAASTQRITILNSLAWQIWICLNHSPRAEGNSRVVLREAMETVSLRCNFGVPQMFYLCHMVKY